MRIIDFVDYSGSPHNVEIEPSSEEEYRTFGGSEVLLHEDTKENKTMLKINPGIVYNQETGKAFIVDSRGILLQISEATENVISKYEYAKLAEFIGSKVNEFINRAFQTLSDIEEQEDHSHHHHDHTCNCGSEDRFQNQNPRLNLFNNLTNNGQGYEDPNHQNHIHNQQPVTPVKGKLFERFTNGDAPKVQQEVFQVDDHNDFTSSLKYNIDPNTGAVRVFHTKTGTIDLADQDEIDVLYTKCLQFRQEYDAMLRSKVGQPIFTGNPLQYMMNGGKF